MHSEQELQWLQELFERSAGRFTDSTDKPERLKIGCIGAGYVGGPTMATLAVKCPHADVFVADLSEQRIRSWNEGAAEELPISHRHDEPLLLRPTDCIPSKSSSLPIYEPGLVSLVRACRGKNLFFTTDCPAVIRECDILFVCVNTPSKRSGFGRGAAADLRAWELAARDIASNSYSPKIVVEKSTVPVRTAESLSKVLSTNERSGVKFYILSNPEFLAEGTAVSDLENPDRVLIGGDAQSEVGRLSMDILGSIYNCWVPMDRIIKSNIWSAELSKLVANAFLAQRISSVNAVSALCEKTGADIQEVTYVVGRDSRIGNRFLKASVGFGGSCFKKDLLNLVYLCEAFGLPEVASYWHQVVVMNDYQEYRFSRMIVNSMFNTIDGKKIAIFGVAYKKNTGDTRESPAIEVCRNLMLEGARLFMYDPQVTAEAVLKEFEDHGILLSGVTVQMSKGMLKLQHSKWSQTEIVFDSMNSYRTSSKSSIAGSPNELQSMYRHGRRKSVTDSEASLNRELFTIVSDPVDAINGAHAIVIITEWDEFTTYDYKQFFDAMKKPAFIFDGRNILDHSLLTSIGFEVIGIGKSQPLL